MEGIRISMLYTWIAFTRKQIKHIAEKGLNSTTHAEELCGVCPGIEDKFKKKWEAIK